MTEEHTKPRLEEQAPEAVVQVKRQLSIIWVVPIVALLIGGWLVFKALSEKGPEITITFETAEGLEADKTKVKFKEVEVGKVTDIMLDTELERVVVTVQMHKEAAAYMTDATQFWVVRARVAAGEVTGLGTLFSGAYIGCNPSKEGKPNTSFKGLEKPPVLTGHLPGRHFVLETKTLGSLDIGSPVYYRGIKVGQVVEYDFDAQAEAVNVRVFVSAPYHEKVRQNTRFWNASGIDLELDTEGVRLDTQSLVSIMLGGVSFDLPKHLNPVDQAEAERVFTLYNNREEIEEQSYYVKRYYMMYFDQNVRGLLPGAPVEIRGIKIGEVVDIKLEIDADDLTARVAVLVLIEPERIHTVVRDDVALSGKERLGTQEEVRENLVLMVEKGFRAQLKTGNLLTGQLIIDIDIFPDAPSVKVASINGHPVFPTIPAPFEQITHRVNNILKKVEKIPLEEIGEDLRIAVSALHKTLEAYQQVAKGVDAELLPKLNASLTQLQETLAGVEETMGPDSVMSYNARKISEELSVTIRSLRSMLDTLERDPQALILGKEEIE